MSLPNDINRDDYKWWREGTEEWWHDTSKRTEKLNVAFKQNKLREILEEIGCLISSYLARRCEAEETLKMIADWVKVYEREKK